MGELYAWLQNNAVTIIIGIGASLLASLILLWYQQVMDRKFCKKYFGSLDGDYTRHFMTGEQQDDAIVIVTHGGGNIMKTRCDAQGWIGTIWMNRDCPDFGSGIYRHHSLNRDVDCGRHEIQVNRENGSINVLWENTSHEGKKSGSLLWRRVK